MEGLEEYIEKLDTEESHQTIQNILKDKNIDFDEATELLQTIAIIERLLLTLPPENIDEVLEFEQEMDKIFGLSMGIEGTKSDEMVEEIAEVIKTASEDTKEIYRKYED